MLEIASQFAGQRGSYNSVFDNTTHRVRATFLVSGNQGIENSSPNFLFQQGLLTRVLVVTTGCFEPLVKKILRLCWEEKPDSFLIGKESK